jgi:hypothetical protein
MQWAVAKSPVKALRMLAMKGKSPYMPATICKNEFIM